MTEMGQTRSSGDVCDRSASHSSHMARYQRTSRGICRGGRCRALSI